MKKNLLFALFVPLLMCAQTKENLKGIDPEVTSTVASLGQGETFFTPPQSKNYLMGVRLTL